MDLRSLRLYLAVLEHGSITKASESAHVAQPALGLHIRKLEEELGLQLLERHSRGVRVTEAGALLAKHSEVILRYVDLAKEEMTNYAKVPSGHFSIGLTPTAREAISVPLVERVSRDLPAVQLTVKEALSELLVEYLLDHRVDAALIYNTREGGDQLVFEPLASESMYFVYPLKDGKRPKSTITLAEVMQHRLILPTRPHLVRTEVDRLAGNLGVEANIVHEVELHAGDPGLRQPRPRLLGHAAWRRGERRLRRHPRQPAGGRAGDQAHPAPGLFAAALDVQGVRSGDQGPEGNRGRREGSPRRAMAAAGHPCPAGAEGRGIAGLQW